VFNIPTKPGKYSTRINRRAAIGGWALLAGLTVVAPASLAVGPDPIVFDPTNPPLDVNGLPSSPIRSFKGLQPLLPLGLEAYIADPNAAAQLGKALFWDTQVGSDGMACASCHFHAGADIRTKNQVNPGLKANDPLFSMRSSKSAMGPNKQFESSDFPFHRLNDDTDRDSKVVFDTNDVFSSQGTFGGDYISSKRPGGQRIPRLGLRRNEDCTLTYNPLDANHPDGSPFHANNMIFRKVEPRNTPTMINAVFNLRQFWDGRANNQFNGVDPFGRRTYMPRVRDNSVPESASQQFYVGNPDAKSTGIIVSSDPLLPSLPRRILLSQPLIENASLASQAVGPALSDFEMSCGHKTFPDLGRKLVAMKPLATQLVHADDSLFSASPELMNAGRVPGLNTTYKDMIQKAFKPRYWNTAGKYTVSADGTPLRNWRGLGYTQMEHNFSLFWGLAIQAYEQLLISDDTPFDRYMDEKKIFPDRPSAAMSVAAQKGMDIFNNKGNCFECHAGAPLSSAAVTHDFNGLSPAPVEGMFMRDGERAMYDGGYYNIGVRPAAEDIGTGATDPYGFDLSYTRQFRWQRQFGGTTTNSPDNVEVHPCNASDFSGGCLRVPPSLRDAVDGSFKTPQLRNVGLTPPYFHNGGTSNLKDVIRFYNRGGDRRTVASFVNNNDSADTAGGDTSGLDAFTPFDTVNKTNLAPGVGEPVNATRKGLGLTEEEMDNLVEFMLALTDDRVACHSGVFDHPELPLAMGQKQSAKTGTRIARDIVATLPATGQTLGLRGVTGECFPNSGDIFGSVNKSDPRPLQRSVRKILRSADSEFSEGHEGHDR
jgi:cytochrome c peroxidase